MIREHAASTAVAVFSIPYYHRPFFVLCYFEGREVRRERLWCPFFDQFIYLLCASQHTSLHPSHTLATDLIGQRYVLRLFCGIGRRQEVVHGEEEEKEFDRGSHRIVLVTGADISDDDGGAGYFLELVDGFMDVVKCRARGVSVVGRGVHCRRSLRIISTDRGAGSSIRAQTKSVGYRSIEAYGVSESGNGDARQQSRIGLACQGRNVLPR